jgi:hypothetical protein
MKYAGIFLFLAVLFACSTARVVKTEKAPGVDFSTYKTYDFYELEASGDTTGNKFGPYTALLRQAISKELNAKGYQQRSADPDLRVNIGIVVKEETQTRETNIREAPRYMGQRRYSWKSEQVEVGRYKVGTATIDLVDSRKDMMVWQGIMEGIVSNRKSNYESDVNKGVTQLFEKFPD